MLDEAESGIGGHLTLTGAEFGELAPLDQASAVARLSVFARVEPSHKSALVDALREQVRAYIGSCCCTCSWVRKPWRCAKVRTGGRDAGAGVRCSGSC